MIRINSRAVPGFLVVVVVVVAALVPEIRLPVLVGLVLLFLLAGQSRIWRWSVAAVIPASVYLVWAALPIPVSEGIEWCADALSPVVLRTAGGALAVSVVVGLLAWRLGSSRSALGLVRPSSATVIVSLVVGLVVALGSVALGTLLAEPFFGPIELSLNDPWAIVGALLFATASGSMQEVAYRGAMLAWLTPGMGIQASLVAQAVAFGASHTGPDYVASPLPVVMAVGIGGLIAGYIVQRYRSLFFVIVVHAAFDVPLFYVAACRLA